MFTVYRDGKYYTGRMEAPWSRKQDKAIQLDRDTADKVALRLGATVEQVKSDEII